MKQTVIAVAAAVLLVAGTPARAHHSYADFLNDTVSVEGTLEKVLFANPHTILTLRARDGAIYTANWRAASQLDRTGVRATDLKVGDVVIVSGTPSKDPAARQLARLSAVRRGSDGWTWTLASGRVSVGATN
jgi:hypothetical protein